jgi:hypothetical protein
MWIGGVLPKKMKQDAGRGYCYAERESNLKHVRFESNTTRADETRSDRIGLLRLRARRGPGLPDLGCLLVGRNALPDNPLHSTLGGEVSTSETPTAR